MTTYLIQAGPSPTTDFYFANRHLGTEILLKSTPNQYNFTCNDTLIFIRYINKEWINYLKKLPITKRPRLLFFIDDDVFDTAMHVGLPWHYRWKLYCFAARYKKQLQDLGFALWVSTPWLMEKYHTWRPTLCPPQNPYCHAERKDIVFYHGTASHMAEIEWLLPVFEKVVKQNKTITIEVIGNKKVQQLFKQMAEVHVYYPMSWYSYRQLISNAGRIIGLAPLLSTPFNQARSATKFFDITQAGAVGIYADSHVYADTVVHGETGLLLPMDQDIWAEHIVHLAGQPKLRETMWKKARDYIDQ